MADKKPIVKFQEEPGAPDKPQTAYKNAAAQKEQALTTYNRVEKLFKQYTANDPTVRRKDTAIGLQKLLEQLKEAMQALNQGTFEDKNKNYYLVYNATIYMFDICRALRKSVYQYLAIEYIAFCIISMECSLTLCGVKYLDWRVKLYIELAHIYHSLQSIQVASRTIDAAIQKVMELKEVEDRDQPLPDYIDKILKQNIRLLRILELKFKVQSGLPIDQWKKKLEEYFTLDKEAKILAIIESLRLSPPALSNTLKQSHSTLKENIFNTAYDLIKPQMEKIAVALEQQMDKITKTVDMRQKTILEDILRQESVKQRRDYEASLIKDKDWRSAAEALPLEYHVELAHHAYDVNNMKAFDEISASALIRCKYRRIEVPYISHIKIYAEETPNPNIANGYEKINIDINEASLRNELKKLRNRSKKNEKQEQVQVPSKDNKKDNKDQQAQIPVQDQIGCGVIATESELSQIKHKYIYLAYKRSMTPDNAIYDIDIVMANQETGPTEKLAEGYIAIAIDISQYTGVREKYKTVPYLIFKYSENELADERQKMSLLVDIRPLFGKNPLIRPDYGFTKLPTDLRQIPKEFIRNSMDYLYLTYKTDNQFFVKEREIQVLTAFQQLEVTYQKEVSQSLEDDVRLELEISYNILKLKSLFEMIEACLDGPLGEQFLQEKKDFLNQIIFLLWKKYILSPLYQMQFIQELLITEQMQKQDYRKYDNVIQQAKAIFKQGFLVMNRILFKLPYMDIIFLCKLNLSLAKYLEEDGEPYIAITNLSTCIQKIVEHRNKQLSRGNDSNKDLFLPFCLTSSNRKISLMVEAMKEQYVIHKNQIMRQIRINNRTTVLDDDELNEEEYEVLEAQMNLLRDDNKDIHKINTIIPDYDLIIHSLHADLLVTYFRCLIKAGQDSQKKQTKKASIEDGVQGVSIAVQKKMSIMQQETAQTIRKNRNSLQNTLQKDGQIPIPKPLIQDYEQNAINIVKSNPYQQCLLYLVIASNKPKQTEQRALLQESLQYLKEAEKEEQKQIDNGIRDAMFIMSTLCDNVVLRQKSDQVFPYRLLYDPLYIKSSQCPRKPILISRTSEQVTFKMPPFKPKLLDIIATDPAKKVIKSMAIFGKVSANGVNVSLTNNDLINTGTRQPIDQVVTIPGLVNNEKYCFASAAYDGTEGVSNQIGETTDDIVLLHPLPLPLLASYLSKTAYQLSNFDVCEEAADICIGEFTESSDVFDQLLKQNNPIFVKRLIQSRILKVDVLIINNLTETLLIKAKCLQKQITHQGTPASKYIQLLKICNYLLLALETCLSSRSFTIAKRIVAELYNMLELFTDKSIHVFHLMLKAQMVITEIPKQYWDSNMRILSTKLTYEILRQSLKLNEITLGRRTIYASLQGFNRKWYQIPKMIEVEVQEVAQKKDAKKPTKEELAPVTKYVNKLVRDLYETTSVQDYLEETLLMMHDEFGEYVINFIEKWREQIEVMMPFVELPGDHVLGELTAKLEFWDIFKDLSTAAQKMNKNSPLYLEMLCKLLRRMIQAGVDYKIINTLTTFNEAASQPIQIGQDLYVLHLKAIEADIEFYPALWPELIQDKETNKVGNDLAIEIFEEYGRKKEQLLQALRAEISEVKPKTFENISIWRSELSYLKALLSIKGVRIRTVLNDQFLQNLDLERLKEMVLEQESLGHKAPVIEKQQVAQVQDPKDRKAGKPAPPPVVELTEEEELLQITISVFKNISEACNFALQARSFAQMLNQLKFLYNFLLKEQITPFMHKGQVWTYSVMIGDCINLMIREVRAKGLHTLRQNAINQLQLWPHVKNNQIINEPPLSATEPIRPELSTQLSKDVWFRQFKDMDMLSNLQGYIISSLFIEQKYNSLIGISREFCNLTTHYYSQLILPYTISAQQILYKEAQSRTNARKEELKERTTAFQIWEQTKKKKTRTNLLLQETPQEELDYLRDKKDFEDKIELLQQKQNFIESQLKVSERVIQEINRDANQALEQLKNARKLFEKFGQDEEMLSKDNTGDIKQKRKNHKQFGMQVISKYRMAIEVLVSRQERLGQIMALKEVASLNYAMQNYAQAEEGWSESLDTIFQRREVIKTHPLRMLQEEQEKSNQLTAQFYGVQQCLIGVTLCSLLAHYCYYNNVHLQTSCALLASELIASVLKMQLINGLDWSSFIQAKEISLELDVRLVDPAELCVAIEKIAQLLIDREEYLRVIPLTNVLQELSYRLQSNYYSIRSKILRAIALAALGFINQSYQMLLIVQNEKDLPDQSQSLWQNKQHGKWWTSNTEWNNSLPPYDEKSVAMTEQIISIQLNKSFGAKYGYQNENLFLYAQCSLVYNIHHTEIVEKWEINEIRIKLLSKVETQLRALLKKINFEEQLEQKPQSEQLALRVDEAPSLSNQQELNSISQKREERLTLLARSRLLLVRINLSMGLVTRSAYILKSGIENLQRYNLEQVVEEKEEPEIQPLDQLKPQGLEDKKGAKKGAPEKKAGKESKQEEAVIQNSKPQVDQHILQTVEQRKLRRCPTLYWYNHLRAEMIAILFRANRLEEIQELVEQLSVDCKTFTDNYHQRIGVEYSGRKLFKEGKLTECIAKMKDAVHLATVFDHQDVGVIQLHGDFAEMLMNRQNTEDLVEAKGLFAEAHRLSEILINNLNYQASTINQNSNQIKICQELQLPLEIESEIFKKTDKVVKGKKDDKKGKDESKVVKKGADKAQQKKDQIEKPSMPIKPLNQLPNYNFTQQQKLTYANIEEFNNTQLIYNCYLKHVDLYQRSAIRYIDIMLTLNETNEHSNLEKSDQSIESSMTTIYDLNEFQQILATVDISISRSVNVPFSLKLDLFYLQSKIYKIKFIDLLIEIQQTYMEKFVNGKQKKYADFYEKRPFRDLIRNKYFLQIPTYCQILKEQGLPLLQQAKDALKKAVQIIKGECVLFEYNRKPEEILILLAKICLLQREYRNRIGYKYVKAETIQIIQKYTGDEQNVQLDKTIESLEKEDKLEQLNFELEAQNYLKYAINLVQARQELLENFATIALNPIQDMSKLSYDIFTEILEQDYIYKKQYASFLFDESKKKVGVATIDILLYLQKIWRESQVNTFTLPCFQRMISKAHRFLKLSVQSYSKCLLSQIEVAPKNDVNTTFVDEGSIVIKSVYDKVNHGYKFEYILGQLNKDKLILAQKSLADQVKDTQGVCYGSLYIEQKILSNMLQETLDLQQRMQESDKQPPKFKERDYKRHKQAFEKIIDDIANLFLYEPITTKKALPVDHTERYAFLIPELTHDNIIVLVNFFNDIGVLTINANYLAILRYLHHQKYK